MNDARIEKLSRDVMREVDACQYPVSKEAVVYVALAAAEERGRRKGVEERDELRDRMHQTIAFLLSCVASGEKLSDEEEAGIRAMLREGLAPRDSALNAKVGRSDDGLPVVNFDRDALHERAPRDSGKET